jgi:small conductance mechanosensitive channel
MSDLLDRNFWAALWRDAMMSAPGMVLRLLAIAALFLVVRKLLFRVTDLSVARLVGRQARAGGPDYSARLLTLQSLVRSVTGYALLFVFIVMVLQALTVNVTGILTTAGVGGIAIGLGAQRVVRDALAGFFLIVEDHYSVGEYVTIGGAGVVPAGAASGVVQEIGMRITRLVDDQGRLWTIPNGDIVSVLNHSRRVVRSSVDIVVGSDRDLATVRAAVDEEGRRLYSAEPGFLKSAPRCLGCSAVDPAQATLRVEITAEPEHLAEEQLRVREALWLRLRPNGGGPPSP